MAGVGDKTDATAQLPDEVLGHVFSFLSLKDKLRSEAINRKFQRCVLKKLSTTPRLLLYNTCQQQLHGYHIAPDGILGAVQTLTKKCKFTDIYFFNRRNLRDCVQHLDSVLSMLLSEPQCLTEVTSFTTDSGCSQAVLENLLDGCEKLSTIGLNFDVRPHIEARGYSFPLDLGRLFKNRRLTELQLCPILYPMNDLVEMFKQIQPNALRKLYLRFVNRRYYLDTPMLNLDELFDALLLNGSVLEHVNLWLETFDIRFAPMFESLAQLPELSKCNIHCATLEEGSQVARFVPAVTSLLNMSHVNVSVTFDECSLRINSRYIPGCQFVNMIRQIQRVHPSTAVDIDALNSLTLSLGNASICIYWNFEGIEQCGDDNCALCSSFYPSFLSLLRSRAQTAALDFVAAQHLPDWQLDRCKLGKVVDDLNNWTFDRTAGAQPKRWRALSLEENHQEQSITISFETDVSVWAFFGPHVQHHLFSITVSCGQCLGHGCATCVD